MTHTIKLHSYALSGHAQRVELFANIAGICHEVIQVDLANGEHKKAPFLTLNPAGQVPVLEDGDVVISDSNAILVYLARRYAPAYLPKDPILEAQVQGFLSLAAGEIAFGPCAARLITVFGAPLDADFAKATALKALDRLEKHLTGRGFLVGSGVTLADIAVYTYIAHAPEGGISLDSYPNVRHFLKKIESLDGFKPMASTKAGLLA